MVNLGLIQHGLHQLQYECAYMRFKLVIVKTEVLFDIDLVKGFGRSRMLFAHFICSNKLFT
jgi:hypothetical protein